MPSLRGMAPTKMATSMSLKATDASAVGITSECVGGWVGGVSKLIKRREGLCE